MPQDPKLRIMLWVVAVGFFMQTLDSTIVNTALPSMARSLGESPLRMQSVIIAYSLTMAVIIPASGWLADRFGTRTIFQTAIGLFVLGSLLCAWAPSLPMLTAARVVQGAGGAMLRCPRWLAPSHSGSAAAPRAATVSSSMAASRSTSSKGTSK